MSVEHSFTCKAGLNERSRSEAVVMPRAIVPKVFVHYSSSARRRIFRGTLYQRPCQVKFPIYVPIYV